MSQKMRKSRVDGERLKTIAFGRDIAQRRVLRRFDKFFITTAVLWALAAALPSLYVGMPVPYMIGSTVNQDVHSRVEFTWHDARAEALALRNLESGFARRYREEPLEAWAEETHGAVDRFLARTAAADSIGAVGEAAAELGVGLTRDQLGAFRRGAAVARNDPYHYLVSPVKEILDNEIFPQGILEKERFDVERGRTIQIQRGDAFHTALVGGDRGPVTVEQIGAVLDERFRVKLSLWIPREFKDALRDVLVKRVKPNLFYDEAASRAGLEERRQELFSRVRTVRANDLMLTRGTAVTADRMAMLREEERVYRERQGWRLPVVRFVGNFLLFAAIAFAMIVFFRTAARWQTGMLALRQFFATSALGLGVVFAGYGLIYFGLPGTVLPIGIAVGAAAFGMNLWTAVFMAASAALGGLILFEGRPDLMVAHLAAALFFIHTAARCRWRITLLMSSVLSGLIGAIAFIAWNFARGDLQGLFALTSAASLRQAFEDSMGSLLAAGGLLLNWVICGIVMLLCLPLVERFFNVTTRIGMQDLVSKEHPILRRLVIEAPGTFHHCTLVATLAEAAANAIGADGLRARIGGLFHDIGKILKPEYFTENEFGVSRHENMTPNMSALLIINHVRDGAELARSLGLPNIVRDMILQHHGDSIMKFFHHKAQQQAAPGSVVAREPFMYPGPKPQTPEAGVLMIADSVEAAVRSMDRPSAAHLRELISRLIRERLLEGQFEESGLTMRQLARVEEVLFRMLVSMYHTRVKYPGQEKEARKGGRKK